MRKNKCIERLSDEWFIHGKIIIAYDFDNTVYDYYNMGLKFNKVIDLLKECRNEAHFIVFTSCGENHKFIEKYLNFNDIPFDKINENMDFIKFNGRKVYYNILLDDRAGLNSAYKILKKSLKRKRRLEQKYNESTV